MTREVEETGAALRTLLCAVPGPFQARRWAGRKARVCAWPLTLSSTKRT